MATVDGTQDSESSGAIPPLSSVPFVRILVAPTARAISMAAIFTEILTSEERPYQLSISIDPEDRGSPTDALRVAIGTPTGKEADVWIRPSDMTPTVFDDIGPDSTRRESMRAALTALENDFEDRDGEGMIGTVTHDVVSSVASSTLIHGEFSGDQDVVAERFGPVEDPPGRDFRTAVAFAVLESQTTPGTATAVSHFLDATPTPNGPFATDVGTFDALDVVSARHPTVALAVACGQTSAIDTAIEIWHEEAEKVHTAVRRTDLDDEGDLCEVRVEDAPLAPIARLARTLTAARMPVLVYDEKRTCIAPATHEDDEIVAHMTRPIDHGDGRLCGDIATSIESIRSAFVEVET